MSRESKMRRHNHRAMDRMRDRVGDSPTVSEPRTAAGRDFLQRLIHRTGVAPYIRGRFLDADDILAIEAEAAQPIDVERKPDGWHAYHICDDRLRSVARVDGGLVLCEACGETMKMTVWADSMAPLEWDGDPGMGGASDTDQ